MTALVVIGASFRTAPVGVRERLALTAERNRCLVAGIVGNGDAAEAVAISTCNRTELYLTGDDAVALARTALAELRAVAGEHDLLPAEVFYDHRGDPAALHLYRVAAGLDSLVPGEAEVLGQVREAIALARAARGAGPVLSRLFDGAIDSARRVRGQTAIGENAASIGSVAAGVAAAAASGLEGAAVLVIGAGQTAELVVTSLAARGAGTIRVTNRTLERAVVLATRFGGEAVPMSRLASEVARADIVVSATHAPHAILTPAEVGDRTARPLLVIDLAVPRDADPALRLVPGVVVHDVDALETTVSRNLALRESEAVAGEAIVAREVEAFRRWLVALDVVPAITGLRALAEAIRRDELDRVAGRFEAMTPRDRELIEQVTRTIVNKLLHEPTVRMKDGPELARTVQRLFDLPVR